MLALGTLHTRGKGSGGETDVTTAAVVVLREGRVATFKDHGDRARAPEAAGLSE